MIHDLRFTILKRAALLSLLSAICHLPSALHAQTDGFPLLGDTNGALMTGFSVPAPRITGVLQQTNLPATSIATVNTNLSILFSNTLNGAFSLVTTNGHFRFRDEYGTTNDFTTNGFAITWTNGNFILLTNGSITVSGQFNGNGAGLTNTPFASSPTFINASNYLANAFTNYWNPFTNSYNVFTNWITTNTAGGLAANAALDLTNLYSTSNALSVIVNYNLISVSNGLQLQIQSATNYSAGASNNVMAYAKAVNTSLINVSNTVNAIIASKALTATVPSTYASIGIGFSTPLMPDGNYSVSLLPQNAQTAGALTAGDWWYVASKNASGFTIYLNYATNYNLYFDCQVQENTQ